MKELLIKEKAKRYDEVIERANSLLSGNQLGNTWIYKLLPELKESEDECMRRALIKFTHENQYMYTNYNGRKITKEEFIMWLEKQCEQEPADKVEPKFKVGYWIISHYNHVAYIKSIDEKYYFLSLSDGNSAMLSIDCIDKNWRFWTIEDAKDGDVLAAHECLVLFKEIDGLNIKCYCAYHYMNHQKFYVDTLQNKTAFCPATKEQRDLLFQKMREAGYEWDAENKELKWLVL